MKKLYILLPALIALFFSFALTSFSTFKRPVLVEDILRYTNEYRRANGLSTLVISDELNELAVSHSSDMANGKRSFGHSGFEQRSRKASRLISGYKGMAENVAYGARNGKEVVNMWMNSNGHRKNILGSYKYTGIGTARDSKGRIYYTQIFVR